MACATPVERGQIHGKALGKVILKHQTHAMA